MKRNVAGIWPVALLVLVAGTLAPDARSQRWMVAPSAAHVFLGWLQKADCVQVHLPNGNFVSYGGEKLALVVNELEQWQKYAEEKEKRTPAEKKK